MLGKLGTLALGVDMSDGGSSMAPKPGPLIGFAVRSDVAGSIAAVSVFCSMPVAVMVLPPKLRSEVVDVVDVVALR